MSSLRVTLGGTIPARPLEAAVSKLLLRYTCWWYGGHRSTNQFASHVCDRCGLRLVPKPWKRRGQQ